MRLARCVLGEGTICQLLELILRSAESVVPPQFPVDVLQELGSHVILQNFGELGSLLKGFLQESGHEVRLAQASPLSRSSRARRDPWENGPGG
jgi:hypothetical protein